MAKKVMIQISEVTVPPDMPVYTSGVVCSLLGIPVWVLKQLDTEEIVSPKRQTRNQGRMYSQEELKMVQHCWYYLSKHDVKISGLKVILQMEQGTFKRGE